MKYFDSDTGIRPISVSELRAHVVRIWFGDQYGLLLFFGALAFFGLYWRVDFFINDNYTVANALYNLAHGHLSVTNILYGPPSGDTPGMVVADGHLYGRNYGQVAISLPVVYALQGLAHVADLRLVVVGLWTFSVLGFCYQLGRLADREVTIGVAGSIVSLALFALDVSLATDLSTRWIPLVALQLTSMVAAALTGVLIYRLVTRLYSRRDGVAAGTAVVLATPVGFWASIPKRHTYMAMLVVGTVYCFYRSRDETDPSRAFRFRALAYAVVGLATWLQPAEALVAFVSLVGVDVWTARSNRPRELAVLCGVFALSLLPFFLTNVAIAGNPLLPPRSLPDYVPPAGATSPTVSPTQSTSPVLPNSAPSSSPSSPAPSLPARLRAVQSMERIAVTCVGQVDRFAGFISAGVAAVGDPTRLYHVFVRGGYLAPIAEKDGGAAVNLSILESAPLFGLLLGYPLVALTRYWRRSGFRPPTAVTALRSAVTTTGSRSALSATDLFVAILSLLFVLVYLPRLPLHAMVTVRYLVPIMPLFVYAVVRSRRVRALLRYSDRLLAFTYLGSVLVAGQLVLLFLLTRRATLGESMQIHAWLDLVAVGVLVLWFALDVLTSKEVEPLGVVALGFAGGLTTDLILFSGLFYFGSGAKLALPVMRWLGQFIHWL